jgi:CheY-like chemotaxis protein
MYENKKEFENCSESMKKILVVDDEFEVREVLSEFLTLKKFKVSTAEDGLDGLRVFKTFKPDLAIVDVRMPNLDGPGFSKKILTENPDFPIIIISGYIKQYDADEIRALGVREIINKPLNFESLYQVIKNILKK